jgi:shikimate kinase
VLVTDGAFASSAVHLMAGSDLHIALIGMMASGKTTIGRLVAASLGRAYVDNDDRLVERVGRSAREIEEQDGLPALHRLEISVLREALADASPAVVAAAASTVDDAGCREALAQKAFAVWLALPPDVIAAKVAVSDRPRQGDDIAALAMSRAPLYRELADLVVEVDAMTPEAAAALTVEAFASL